MQSSCQDPLLSCVSSSTTFDGSSSPDKGTKNSKQPQTQDPSSQTQDVFHHPEHSLSSEAQRAYIDKTLLHIESGNADACDVISSVRRFPRSLAVQSVAFEQLKNLSFDKDQVYAIGRVGGVRSTVAAMNHFPNDVALQRCCAEVLKNLATDDEGNANAIDKAGGVVAFVTAM